MKISPLPLIFIVLLGSIFIGNSYGVVVAAPKSDPSLPEVSLQLVLRDSDGQLVAYREPSLMYIRNLTLLHEYLDTIQNRTIITTEGKNFELIQFTYAFQFDKGNSGQITTSSLDYKNYQVLVLRYDGMIAEPHDTLISSWKIIRTIR